MLHGARFEPRRDVGGNLAQGRCLKEGVDRDIDLKGALDSGDNPGDQEGVTAQVENSVMQADFFHAQYL